jgi:BCD family chlorophyll transporter-like MFS transporter
VALNVIALWKQEARNPERTAQAITRPAFRENWSRFYSQPSTLRFLFALGLGTAAFSMQDVILEPYGGEVLGLSVSATTVLTALMAIGALCAFALAARWLTRGMNAFRVSALGVVVGLAAFSCVIFSEPFQEPLLFRIGAVLIGFGGGLFSVGTLTAAMSFEPASPSDPFGNSGLVLGAWGAVTATATGLSMACGGVIRDAVSTLALEGRIGSVLVTTGTGYSFVYHLEICLLLATLIVIGPMVRLAGRPRGPASSASKFGLAEFPG